MTFTALNKSMYRLDNNIYSLIYIIIQISQWHSRNRKDKPNYYLQDRKTENRTTFLSNENFTFALSFHRHILRHNSVFHKHTFKHNSTFIDIHLYNYNIDTHLIIK